MEITKQKKYMTPAKIFVTLSNLSSRTAPSQAAKFRQIGWFCESLDHMELKCTKSKI